MANELGKFALNGSILFKQLPIGIQVETVPSLCQFRKTVCYYSYSDTFEGSINLFCVINFRITITVFDVYVNLSSKARCHTHFLEVHSV